METIKISTGVNYLIGIERLFSKCIFNTYAKIVFIKLELMLSDNQQ